MADRVGWPVAPAHDDRLVARRVLADQRIEDLVGARIGLAPYTEVAGERLASKVVATRVFRKGQAKRTLDIPNLGPATCDVRLVSAVSTSLAYSLRLSLAVEGA